MSNKLELLSGPAITTSLKDSGAKVYRYQLNPIGLYMAIGLAVILFAAGGVLYLFTGLAGAWVAAFVVLMFIGLGCSAYGAYWHQFANEQLVGISDEHLYVGGPKATWAIAWELLDPETIGLKDLEMTNLKGVMQMRVGGQQIDLYLFHPIAFISEIQELMANILSHMRVLEDESASAAELTADEEE